MIWTIARWSVALLAMGVSAQIAAEAQDLSSSRQSVGQPSKDRIVVGLGAAVTPVYQGADDYRVLPLPAIDIVQGRIFANFRNGVGLNLVDDRALTIGAGVTPLPGYRRRDVPTGVDRLSWGVGGRIFANLTGGGVVATLGATQAITGSTGGFVADASLSYPIILNPKVIITPSIATSFADGKHMDGYFGVNAREAAASGLDAYRGKAGFKDVSALLNIVYRLDSRWSVTGSVGATSLLGRVKDSPLVEHATRPTGFVALAYRF
jgi:MipA family protein